MGKIKISKLGTADEAAEKQKAKIKREQKEKREAHLSGMRGGEKLVDMSGPIPESTVESSPSNPSVPSSPPSEKKEKKTHSRGRSYQSAQKLVDHNKLYSISGAIDLLKKMELTKFDPSVEVHINCTEKGLRGQVNLPHGIGKEIRVAIADDALIDKVNSGKIDFDVLVATPSMMPKLARVAKILGPRGLMPNPKAGTISDKPEELAKKLSTGQTQFKTETDFPIIHMVIGKVSFPVKDLEDNFQSLTKAIGQDKIISVFLKSTMSPSVQIKL